MHVAHTKAAVREATAAARHGAQRIALVPTMGSLHAGHLSLIERARAHADWVAVSVFVNPLQFGPSEDLATYPRDLAGDVELARERGADLLFAPAAAEMYPDGETRIAVVPEQGADTLCGASRPGHFRGVLTVVAKLFGIFAPDVAVFGQKDFQQAALIRRMVRDLDMAVDVVVAPTVREPDGLAMSSRNAYLSPHQRELALALSRAMRACDARFLAGETDAAVLRAAMKKALAVAHVYAEYADVVDADTLQPLQHARRGAVCAIAARVGTTRLIDNMVL